MNIYRKKKNLKYPLLILIAISLFIYTYLFFTYKESYDGDEIWSYGLSNSYYNPFLHNSGTWDNNKDSRYLQNFNTWITGGTFHDYLTVQENERFSYDSVWYNQSADVHPPFYYALLHTICSIFPDTFSPWFGLIINYFSFVTVMFLLYKQGAQFGSETFALIICGFYAFSAGAEDTYTFIRMYALSAAFAMLLFQLMQSYLSHNKKNLLLHLLCVTVFSCLTHYYLIVYAFFLTAVTEIYLLLKKRWKNFWALGITMTSGVLLSIFLFPSMIYHLLYRSGDLSTLNLSFRFQGKLIISLIMQQFMGFSIPSHETMFFFYLCSVLIVAVIIMLITFFIFRNEHLASRFLKSSYSYIHKFLKMSKKILLSIPCTIHILCITLFCIYIFYVKTLPIASMKTGSIRYFFPFYPLLYLAIGILLKQMLSILTSKKIRYILSLTIVTICTICSNILATHTFLYTANPQFGKSISDLPDNGYYIVTATIPHAINNFAVELQNKRYSYFIEENNFTPMTLPSSLQMLPDNDDKLMPVYLLFTDMDVTANNNEDQKIKEEWISSFTSLPYITEFELIGQDVVNGYSILIYQLR